MNLLEPITSYLNARKNLAIESQVLLRQVHTALAFILQSNKALLDETSKIQQLPSGLLFCMRPEIVELRGNYPQAVASVYVEEVCLQTYGIGNIGGQGKLEERTMIIAEEDGHIFLKNPKGTHLRIDEIPGHVLGIVDDIFDVGKFRIPRYRYYSHTFLL